ncbi:hypothetical protein [Sphingopyxis sp. NJF-3]
MTEFDKAWREFIDAVADALRIPPMLDWLTAFIDRHPWIGRIPSVPPALLWWAFIAMTLGAPLIALAYLWAMGQMQ